MINVQRSGLGIISISLTCVRSRTLVVMQAAGAVDSE